MDESRFRRLCFDALEGRLQGRDYEAWRHAIETDPDYAGYYANLSRGHAGASARLGLAPPPAPVRKLPAFWILAPLVLVSAGLAGAWTGMQVARKVHPAPPAQSPQAQRPTEVPARHPLPPEAPVQPPAEPEPPPPVADTPDDEPNSVPMMPILPPPPAAHIEPWFVPASGARIRFRAADSAGPRPANGYIDGDTLTALEDSALTGGDAWLFLRTGTEAAVVAPRAVELRAGALLLRVLGNGFRVRCGGAMATLAVGDYALTASPPALTVLAGEAAIEIADARHSAGWRARVNLADGQTQQVPLATVQSLRGDFARGWRDLLRWEFEDGPGDCELGRLEPDGRDGGGAMHWNLSQPGIGTTRFEPLFVMAEGARLRMWVNTDGPAIEVSARIHLTDGVRNVGLRIELPPGEGWRMVDVPLADLRGGPLRDHPGLVPGAGLSGLHVFAHGPAGQPLARRSLAIDELHVYAPR